ncbi:hypothetical protein TUMEXPCC7403_13025 [Tumidithrix helvetica PCC 7403]|uniref:hypothetical protein n=1 Tax=Tumidithrix helvetica TaxID=3457545 RepID=UPI003CB8F599
MLELVVQLSTQLAISIQQTELFQLLQVLNKSLTKKAKEQARAHKFSENLFRPIFDKTGQVEFLIP